MNNIDMSKTLANCAAISEYCADACLHEDNIKLLVECIRLVRDCSTIYKTAMEYVARD